jgi:hypothetical protein
MNDFLVSESVLSAIHEDVRGLLQTSELKYRINIDDEFYGPAFRNYLVFSRWPFLLKDRLQGETHQAILYNAYYWILKFSHLYMRKHGFDAGIEQYVFKTLEQAKCDFDWSTIEQIEKAVESETRKSS